MSNNKSLLERYGKLALVAGASEGLGAAFAKYLAAAGMDLILLARRKEPLEQFAEEVMQTYPVKVSCLCVDLSDDHACKQIEFVLRNKEINMLVYNAALSYIGPFEKDSPKHHLAIAQTNMITPVNLIELVSPDMLARQKGAIILMSSLAGFQGSGYLAMYAATKAFNRVLAESLWYEWKNKGVDVMACCAGAIATPNFKKTNPEKKDFLAPRVQLPEEVVQECFKHLGRKPSFIAGTGNKVASFIMHRIMSGKMSVTIMGNNTRKMYRL